MTQWRPNCRKHHKASGPTPMARSQISLNQTEIVAVARAQHQSVIAKHDRTAVTVNRGVPHVDNGHWPTFDRCKSIRA
jgi:hypothetical protein